MIESINQFLRDGNQTYRVISIPNYVNRDSKVLIECEIHGLSCDWGTPWLPSIRSVSTKSKSGQNGVSCPKCSGRYSESELEAVDSVNKKLEQHFKKHNLPTLTVNGFIGGYALDKSICLIECELHGLGNDWNTPWTPRLNHLRRSGGDSKNISGCPKCSKTYRYSEQEYIQQVNNKIGSNNLKLLKIEKFKNIHSRCYVSCQIHGDGWRWDLNAKWFPTISKLLQGQGCPRCNRGPFYTENENIERTNKFITKNFPLLSVEGAINYEGNQSRAIVRCKEHGLGSEFGNKWEPTFESLNYGSNCPKCSKIYAPTEVEAFEYVNIVASEKGMFVPYFKGHYKGAKTRCNVVCEHHGDLSAFNDFSWPTIDNICNAKTSCFLCAKERHTLVCLLKNPIGFSSPRKLYYIEFTDVETQLVRAYKIGVFAGTFRQRWSESRLRREGLYISKKIIKNCTSIDACLTESYILRKYSNENIFFPPLKNWGATECFHSDVIGIDEDCNLDQLHEEAILDFSNIIKNIDLSFLERLEVNRAWQRHIS
ncbi:hypothetical protein AN944_00654 [Shewanella sp. P1-14-1]|uniref:hypothetical protein n=1 Tax=Shewanella sp. P1-14-1 TaxID=1723761 RepID=UPI0006D66498|nr:hypothetical protein [Shewanella sp. P1-14-1]KPZ72965.1 hypothetical protein AN944_00654 [Shewanella sp. P1-14-1]